MRLASEKNVNRTGIGIQELRQRIGFGSVRPNVRPKRATKAYRQTGPGGLALVFLLNVGLGFEANYRLRVKPVCLNLIVAKLKEDQKLGYAILKFKLNRQI